MEETSLKVPKDDREAPRILSSPSRPDATLLVGSEQAYTHTRPNWPSEGPKILNFRQTIFSDFVPMPMILVPVYRVGHPELGKPSTKTIEPLMVE